MNIFNAAAQLSHGVITLRDWLGSGSKVVDQATAQRRADICLKCPLREEGSGLTGAIADAVRRQVELKNHLRLRVRGEKTLGKCSVCGCVNRLKIWVPLERLLVGEDADSLAKYAEQCWLRKERTELISAVRSNP